MRFAIKIETLDTTLLESKREQERLLGVLESVKDKYTEEPARVEDKKREVMNDLAEQIECLSTNLHIANTRNLYIHM